MVTNGNYGITATTTLFFGLLLSGGIGEFLQKISISRWLSLV